MAEIEEAVVHIERAGEHVDEDGGDEGLRLENALRVELGEAELAGHGIRPGAHLPVGVDRAVVEIAEQFVFGTEFGDQAGEGVEEEVRLHLVSQKCEFAIILATNQFNGVKKERA